jgi:hypothetical protein
MTFLLRKQRGTVTNITNGEIGMKEEDVAVSLEMGKFQRKIYKTLGTPCENRYKEAISFRKW